MTSGAWRPDQDPLRIVAVATQAAAVVLLIAVIVVSAILLSNPAPPDPSLVPKIRPPVVPLPDDEGKAIAAVKIDDKQFDKIERMVADATERQAGISREIAGSAAAIAERTGKIADDVAAIREQGSRIIDGVEAIAKIRRDDETILNNIKNIGYGVNALRSKIGVLLNMASRSGGCSDSDGCLGELYFVHDWPLKPGELQEGTCEQEWEFSQPHFEVLDYIVARLWGRTPRKVVFVEGHASAYGSELYNTDLSQRRAELVACYLKSRLIPRNEQWRHCIGVRNSSSREHNASPSGSDSDYRMVRIVIGQGEC